MGRKLSLEQITMEILEKVLGGSIETCEMLESMISEGS